MFTKLFSSNKYLDRPFEELPKGYMFQIAMNPYNGNVFVSTSKHLLTDEITLDLLRRIVRACDARERAGSSNPLSEVLESARSFNWNEIGNVNSCSLKVVSFSGFGMKSA